MILALLVVVRGEGRLNLTETGEYATLLLSSLQFNTSAFLVWESVVLYVVDMRLFSFDLYGGEASTSIVFR